MTCSKIFVLITFSTCVLLFAEESVPYEKDPLREQREWFAKRKTKLEEEHRDSIESLTEKHGMRLYKLKVQLEETKFDEVDETELPAVMEKHNALLEAVREEIKTLPVETQKYLAYVENIEKRLKDIILPMTTFRDVKLQDAVQYFNDAVSGCKCDANQPTIKFVIYKYNDDVYFSNVDANITYFTARYTSLYIISNTVMDITHKTYRILDDGIIMIFPFYGGDRFDHMFIE